MNEEKVIARNQPSFRSGQKDDSATCQESWDLPDTYLAVLASIASPWEASLEQIANAGIEVKQDILDRLRDLKLVRIAYDDTYKTTMKGKGLLFHKHWVYHNVPIFAHHPIPREAIRQAWTTGRINTSRMKRRTGESPEKVEQYLARMARHRMITRNGNIATLRPREQWRIDYAPINDVRMNRTRRWARETARKTGHDPKELLGSAWLRAWEQMATKNAVRILTATRKREDLPYPKGYDRDIDPDDIGAEDQIGERIFKAASDALIRRSVDRVLADLDPRERRIITMKHGIEGNPHSARDIASAFGCSKERINQILRIVVPRLRADPVLQQLYDELDI